MYTRVSFEVIIYDFQDLAARNILVDEHRTCKVSDFGMSREIKVDETYDTQVPIQIHFWFIPYSGSKADKEVL